MLINGTHVQGIYSYKNSLEYEIGDFVVDDDMCIYICTAKNPTNTVNNTVSGKKPSEDPDNFSIYLANKTATVRDYVDYITNKSGAEDKYISNLTLSGILQRQFFGLNDAGLIEDSVIYDVLPELPEDSQTLSILYSSNLQEAISSTDSSSGVLDRILEAPSLNNGILKIAANVPGISELFSKTLENDSFVILRQYTYSNSVESYTEEGLFDQVSLEKHYRVQELSDPKTGTTLCRYSAGTLNTRTLSEGKKVMITDEFDRPEWKYLTASSWRTLMDSTKDNKYEESISQIKAYYLQTMNAYKAELSQLSSFYRTAVAWSAGSSIDTVSLNIRYSVLGITKAIQTNVPLQVSVGTIALTSGNVRRIYTTTIDLYDANNGEVDYYINDDISIRLTLDKDNMKFNLQIVAPSSINCYIKEVNYRKYFKQ